MVTGLNDVTLSFGVDEFVVVTGSSGSGKSTLLNILSGTDYATSGQYLVDDIDTDSFDEKDWSNFRCQNIGIIYQDNKLIENYTVKENIEAAIALCCSKKKERKKKINQILKDTGLSFPIQKLNKCYLKYNNFENMNFKKFDFIQSSILESVFENCNLAESNFKNCELKNTEFSGCDLRKSDFRKATGYNINLATNRIKGARFSYPEVINLLNPFEIVIEK